MATHDPLFDVSIDALTTSREEYFPCPPHWHADTQRVAQLTVDIHTNMANSHTHALPIITMHDVGQNASTLSSLFSHARRVHAPLDAASAHYHITAPGHEPRAPNAASNAPFAPNHLANALLALLDRFSLTRVVAIGVGTGANVLLRTLALRPAAFVGLVLISPVLHPAPISERLSETLGGTISRGLGLGVARHVKDHLIARWLSEETKHHIAAVASVEEAVDRLNPTNVSRFIAADSWRDACSHIIKHLHAHILFVTGKESSLRYHVDDHFHLFDPANTSWLDVQDCGSLVHEENPQRVVEAVKLFLQGLPGYT